MKDTKAVKFARFFANMSRLGISFQDADSLRRIEMTLGRWGCLECGDSNEYGSWAIERDEKTERPYMVRHNWRHGQGKDTVTRYPVPDREKGAIKRTEAILSRYPSLWYYYQTDPRGASLYVGRRADIPEMGDLSSLYTRGVAVCI